MACRGGHVRLAVGMFVVLAHKTAHAGPAETYGYLSRSTALGGAVSADVSDSSASFYNPAGLASARGVRFDMGYVRANAALKTNGFDNQVDPVRGLVFGLVAPGEVAKVPFAFGLALHLPDDRVFRVRALDQEQPRWEIYDNRPQRIFLSVNLAIKPVSWLEVGGGLVFLAATRARLDITGELDLGSPALSELRHEVDADLKSIRYPQLGVRISPKKNLRFAAVYRGEFQLTLDIEARLNVAAKAIGLSIPLLTQIQTASVNAFLPRNVVVGASWDPTPDLTFDMDFTWVNWSRYRSPVTAVKATTKLDTPPGFPSSFIPETPAETIVYPPAFKDRFVPRVGLEYRLGLSKPVESENAETTHNNRHELAVRLGYFYEKSPVPDQSRLTNYVDADRHAFSAGLGLKLHRIVRELPGDLRLDLHGQYSALPERTFEKANAASLVGDYRASGSIWSAGLTLGLDLY